MEKYFIDKVPDTDRQTTLNFFAIESLLKRGVAMFVINTKTEAKYKLALNTVGDLCYVDGNNTRLLDLRDGQFKLDYLSREEMKAEERSVERNLSNNSKAVSPFVSAMNELNENIKEKNSDQLMKEIRHKLVIRQLARLCDKYEEVGFLNENRASIVIRSILASQDRMMIDELRQRFKEIPLLRRIAFDVADQLGVPLDRF